MHLLIGTNNRGKFIEISEALSDVVEKLFMPRDLKIVSDPEETGETFEENALQKARHFFEHGKIPTLADDSGIIIDALQNELGIHTRRWGAGPAASDEEWIVHFLKRMENEENRSARFVCNLAYINQDGNEMTFEGVCEGVITEKLEAEYLPGLPISACFKPEGCDCVYSAMKIEQKNCTSHRGRALNQVKKFLLKHP